MSSSGGKLIYLIYSPNLIQISKYINLRASSGWYSQNYWCNGVRLWDITKYQRDGWLLESSKWLRPSGCSKIATRCNCCTHVGDRPGHDQLIRFVLFFFTFLKSPNWEELCQFSVFSLKKNLKIWPIFAINFHPIWVWVPWVPLSFPSK